MPPPLLTPLQVEATQLFFSLRQSAGFAVAGGAALIVQGLIERQTRDVDLFLLDAAASTITSAAASFEIAIGERGWSHQRVIDQSDFVRLLIAGSGESLIVDLGRDSPAEEPLEATDLGPTLSLRDLAARKTLALFGRAEPRDFADVYDLARRFGRDQLLDWAAEDDLGFDNEIFADMLASIGRLSDEDLPVQARHAPELRAYFRDWAAELAGR
jgi:Nucleotidyl transferase AbiEii toxin, Type IV TA system